MDQLTQLDEHDKQFNHRIMTDLQNSQSASQTWLSYLSGKYGLKAGDQVTPTGEIIRKVQEVGEQPDGK